MITFVERSERWSVYRCSSGEPVYVAHNAGRRPPWLWERTAWIVLDVVACDRCDALELEEDCTGVADGDTVCESCLSNSYSRCEDCEEWSEESNTVDGSRNVCDACRDSYYYCEDCEEVVNSDYVNSIGDRVVCDSCRDRNYSYCETCDEYFPDEDNHAHVDEGCCESPAMVFTLANDGEAPLQNDTRATVSLPAGTIDAEGMQAIRYLLRGESQNVAVQHSIAIGDKWQTREGNYTKRLSRSVYNATKVAIPSEILSRVGCIARDHSTAVDFPLEITRDLNMSAAEFYHEDSCWWQSYSEGRCALKTNGGFGLRTFGEYDGVTGRAWVMPLAKDRDNGHLAPTFDTVGARAFIVFNGYGKLEGYTPARILAHMTGWTYRKIGFTCRPMFVNGDVGYLVAPEDIAARYTDGNLSLNVDKHSDRYANERVMADV